MNIVQVISDHTQAIRDKTAVIDGDKSVTYAQLLDRVSRLCRTLQAGGVGPGMRIGFGCPDGIDHIVGALAILKAGAAVVPLADSLTADEIEQTVQSIDVHAVVAAGPLAGDSFVRLDPTFAWQARRARGELDDRCRKLGAAFIRFSSGTTGASKGVLLSHRSILERTDAADKGLGITNKDMILWVLAMSHHFVVSILLFLRRGATIVVANQNFPFSVIDAAISHPITFIYASPVHYFLLGQSEAVAPSAMPNLRMAISTTMKMPGEVFEHFQRKFKLAPAEALGIIEIGLPFINVEPDRSQPGCVGRILPDYQLRIGSPDDLGVGEVLIKGAGMFDAYCSPWRPREQCVVEGYFDTGDVGRLDERGRLLLLGRSKTVIVCAGMKVFPEEVEEVLNSHAGVVESLVEGQEHPQFGQVPVARLVARTPPDGHEAMAAEIRALCLRKLSSYKVPVDFTFVQSLAKTPSGKLARARGSASGK